MKIKKYGLLIFWVKHQIVVFPGYETTIFLVKNKAWWPFLPKKCGRQWSEWNGTGYENNIFVLVPTRIALIYLTTAQSMVANIWNQQTPTHSTHSIPPPVSNHLMAAPEFSTVQSWGGQCLFWAEWFMDGWRGACVSILSNHASIVWWLGDAIVGVPAEVIFLISLPF